MSRNLRKKNVTICASRNARAPKMNEMTGKDVYTFSEGSDYSLLKIQLRNEIMIEREDERLSVSCLQILRF